MKIKSIWCIAASAGCAVATIAKTVAMDTSETLHKFAFGSGNHQDLDQPLWSLIQQRKPELWLTLGNNIYADERVYEWESLSRGPDRDAPPYRLREKYEKQWNNTEYSKFRASIPIVGIWDDHDYGRNDAGREYPFQQESQELFLDFLGEPADSPRRTQAGIYTSYNFGSDKRSVKLILLDMRYHKDPYYKVNRTDNETEFKGDEGDNLGDEQWKWLEQELQTSTATFNVIASSIQVLPHDRWFGTESWSMFPKSRTRLLDLIQLSRASGVILLSGNVEFAEINQLICGDDDTYYLTEITSSGMTQAWQQWSTDPIELISAVAYTFANMILSWTYRVDPNVHYGGINFGEVAFDWTAMPPKATISIIDSNQQVRMKHVASAVCYEEKDDAIGCYAGHRTTAGSIMFRMMSLFVVMGVFCASLLVNALVLIVLPLQLLYRSVFRSKTKTD